MNSKLAQITVIELSLVALLFSSAMIYLTYSNNISSNSDYQENLNSHLNALTKLQSFRETVIKEDLTKSFITQDWTNTLTLINKTLKNYELTLSDSSHSKKITTCTATNGKLYTGQFISIYDNTNSASKYITLGVCY